MVSSAFGLSFRLDVALLAVICVNAMISVVRTLFQSLVHTPSPWYSFCPIALLLLSDGILGIKPTLASLYHSCRPLLGSFLIAHRLVFFMPSDVGRSVRVGHSQPGE
ncbi:hypothetical protein F4604DRAFT_556687 [Suillus subluteus]|nr:hypothetical protein F4604DRAFT_556687 [Suillus subluteus]